jgi:hypothetical protein
MNSSNQAIWQAKVAPDLQGRVFSARRLIAWITTPITPLIAGPLADFVLEPAMAEGGSLTGVFGWLVGTGPGAGMALLIIFVVGISLSHRRLLPPVVRRLKSPAGPPAGHIQAAAPAASSD